MKEVIEGAAMVAFLLLMYVFATAGDIAGF